MYLDLEYLHGAFCSIVKGEVLFYCWLSLDHALRKSSLFCMGSTKSLTVVKSMVHIIVLLKAEN